MKARPTASCKPTPWRARRNHPYAGIVYDLTPEQSVYASYTDIFQPQSSQDRNGNVLDPIVGKNYEMGWKGNS
ncbi:TonB-dependent receptor [Achromobacter xylosoxidans]